MQPKTEQAEIIELDAVRQVDQAAEGAAFVDRQAVIATIARKAGGDVIGHLGKGERDHDEIDAARTQRERADDECKQCGDEERDRPLHETGPKTLGGEDADRIAPDAEIGGMAKAHHPAIAHDEIETDGGEREDDDAREQRQHEAVAREL